MPRCTPRCVSREEACEDGEGVKNAHASEEGTVILGRMRSRGCNHLLGGEGGGDVGHTALAPPETSVHEHERILDEAA